MFVPLVIRLAILSPSRRYPSGNAHHIAVIFLSPLFPPLLINLARHRQSAASVSGGMSYGRRDLGDGEAKGSVQEEQENRNAGLW